MKKKQVTVYFKQEDLDAFREACKQNDKTMAAQLLDMAKAYIKRGK